MKRKLNRKSSNNDLKEANDKKLNEKHGDKKNHKNHSCSPTVSSKSNDLKSTRQIDKIDVTIQEEKESSLKHSISYSKYLKNLEQGIYDDPVYDFTILNEFCTKMLHFSVIEHVHHYSHLPVISLTTEA